MVSSLPNHAALSQAFHSIEWIAPADAAVLAPAAGVGWTRALIADLRDPAILPLLRPAPLPGDYADEARPGASNRSYFLARRALLRSLVARSLGGNADDVQIRYDAPGTPKVIAPKFLAPLATCHISVSGRGAIAALAVSSHPVGIDIEPLGAHVEIIADVLAHAEQAYLASLPLASAQHAFLRIWTAKEAWLKARGIGLNAEPAQLRIEAREQTLARGFEQGAPCVPLAGEWVEREFESMPLIAACVTLPEATIAPPQA